jgi:hypothetical protein
MHLTAQHFAVGDKIETKSGKTGVVTHIHGKAGYLFIHNAEQGKTYHVSWASVTKVNGKDAAEVAGKQDGQPGKGDGLGEDLKAKAILLGFDRTAGAAPSPPRQPSAERPSSSHGG